MPELPEVETIKNDLSKKIIGKTIKSVDIGLNRLVKNQPVKFKNELKNNKFLAINRIGKLLIFSLVDNKFLLIHLKMTGQLVYCYDKHIIAGGHSLPKLTDCLPHKYTRIIFHFTDNSALFFNDLRTFGYLQVVDQPELEKIKTNFGIEPLSDKFNAKILTKIIASRQTTIKAVLLNQKRLAGLGNIYVDESLFAAGIRPDRRADKIKSGEIKTLALEIKKVLRKAIQFRGTTFSDYVDTRGKQGNFIRYLRVYGRAKEKCWRCPRGVINKIKVAGRGTCFCPICQK